MTPAVWVIGAKGLLGAELCAAFNRNKWNYYSTDKEIDITTIDHLRNYTHGKSIQYIINCAAYTAVDAAETESEQAFLINATGAENCARVAQEIGAVVVHFSTDYVFDGKSVTPYKETDLPNPCNVYGASKREGEQRIAQCADKYFIIRTAGLFGKYGKNFVSTMLSLFATKTEVIVVNDQIASPTFSADLAEVVCGLIASECRDYGIYHYTNAGEVTWFDFAQEIYAHAVSMGLCTNVVHFEPISADKLGRPALRPAYSVLSKEKISHIVDMQVPQWQDSLRRFLSSL